MAALASVLVGLLGVVGAMSATATPSAAAGSCDGPLGDGQIRVVMVVDPGDNGPRGPMSTCLVVAAGTAGSKILAQRASEIGLPSPRYAGSGLLCGLDGFPATACPVNNGGSYSYWAYFNGSGGNWSFGRDNPFVRRMVDGEIMGWRFTDGSPDGAAPMPRISPTGSLFPPLTAATTAPPAPAPTAAAPAGGSAAGAVIPGPVATGTDPSAVEPAAASDGAVASSTTTAPVVPDEDAPSDDVEELAAEPASSSAPEAGRWVGVGVAVAAVGALTVGAVTRTRARARS